MVLSDALGSSSHRAVTTLDPREGGRTFAGGAPSLQSWGGTEGGFWRREGRAQRPPGLIASHHAFRGVPRILPLEVSRHYDKPGFQPSAESVPTSSNGRLSVHWNCHIARNCTAILYFTKQGIPCVSLPLFACGPLPTSRSFLNAW